MGVCDKNTPPQSPALPEEDFLEEDDIAEVISLDEDMDVTGSSGNDEDIDTEDDFPEIKPERDDAFVVFKKHPEPVISCAFHPVNSNIVATGGMDDKVYVWNTSNPELVLLEASTKDSIDWVKFSPNGELFAAIDLDGTTKVFKGTDYALVAEFELEMEVQWVQWHDSAPILVVASRELVTLCNIPKVTTKVLNVSKHGDIVNYGLLLPDGKTMVCGTMRGNAWIIDLKTGELLKNISLRGEGFHEPEMLYCMDLHLDGDIVLIGYTDIYVASVNSGKFTRFPVVRAQTESQIVALAFARTERHKNIAATCHRSGLVRFWDTSKQMPRCDYFSGGAISGVQWHPTKPVVFTGHHDGQLRMIDGLSGNLLRQFLGHTNMVLAISLSPDAASILSVSDDRTARVFRTKEEEIPQ